MPSAAGHVGHPLPDNEVVLTDVVWARLHARLEPTFSRLELLVSALFDRQLEPHEVVEGLDLGNHIATKLGTLGFSSAADLVRQASAQLEVDTPGLTQAVGMAGLLDDARTAVANAVQELRLMGRTGVPIAVVGAVSETIDEVLWLAVTQGMPVEHHVDGVSSTTTEAAAVLVVVDDPDLSRSRPLVRSIREVYPAQPLLLVSPPGNLAQRSRVVDSVTTILEQGVHPLEIIEETKRAVIRANHPATIAVIGGGAEWLVEHLSQRGIEATIGQSADDILGRIRHGEARGVILTPETGPLKPLEILRMIRTDRMLRSAAVIMISERTSPSQRHAALREGVDDIVPTDIDLDDLAVLIKARLARRAVLEPVIDNTLKSGVVPWTAATVLIERMLTVSFRRNSPVGVALLRFEPTLDSDEDELLDAQIAREFRQEDVIARVDARHMVVALQGVGRQTLLRRMTELHHKFALHERGGRTGGVEFPIDGRSLDELLENAEITLHASEDEHGPAVAGFDWKPEGADAPDILLVDPDVTLGGVLTATFDRRGLRVEQETDAIDALAYLTGHADRALPKLVLIDLDLRGIDGLQFLRQVRESGTMSRFKMVVLSARASESDLRQAFELGIDDFVPKPFSTPLLLHRVNRLLDNS